MTDFQMHLHRREHDDPIPPALAPGMTQEQLDFFTSQTERAVEKGVKEGVRQYRNRAVQGFLVLLVGLIVLTYYQNNETQSRRELAQAQRAQIVASGRAVALIGCNRDFRTQQAFRALLSAVRKQQAVRLTGIERVNALRFWDDVIKISPLPDCRKAENIVTQNPESPVISIDPFYPGSPGAPKAPRVGGRG